MSGVVGSSVNFTWAFSGENIDNLQCTWGTKAIDSPSFQDILVTLDKFSRITTIQKPYSGRVSGVWDGSIPGQVTFTLEPIQKADERFYMCILEPHSLVGGSPVYDTVQLLVVGK